MCLSRTRGGDPLTGKYVVWFKEFIPHTRGWSQAYRKQDNQPGVYPAHAGVILDVEYDPDAKAGLSRTRGGDPPNRTF